LTWHLLHISPLTHSLSLRVTGSTQSLSSLRLTGSTGKLSIHLHDRAMPHPLSSTDSSPRRCAGTHPYSTTAAFLHGSGLPPTSGGSSDPSSLTARPLPRLCQRPLLLPRLELQGVGMATGHVDGDSDDVPCELPHLDILLQLDGDGSKAQGLDLGPTGPDLGLTIFLYFCKSIFSVGPCKQPTL
jgi:hypothetical protein